MNYRPMKSIDYIAIHCSADPADTKKTAADVARYHRSKGWRAVGYHWLIERDGTLVAGRPEDMPGAHERKINRNSVAVCMIGGSPPVGSKEFKAGLGENNFTPEQWETLAEKVTELSAKFPDAKVLGHKDVPGGTPKACPSFEVFDWWDKVQEQVKAQPAKPYAPLPEFIGRCFE